MPPPRVSPPTPVVEMMPPVVASPNAWRRGVEVAPGRAALGPRRRVAGSTRTPRMPDEVDHDAVVARAEARDAVAAAADGDGQAVLARRSRTAAITSPASARLHDHGRPPVDHRVVDAPRLVVPLVLVGDDNSALK